MLSDGTGRDFLGTAHNELRQRAPGEIRRMLKQGLLFIREPGFKPCRLGSNLCGLAHDAGLSF